MRSLADQSSHATSSRPDPLVVPPLPAALTALLLAAYLQLTTTNQLNADRRVVDVVEVGDAVSEAAHGFDGSDVVRGAVNGKAFRQTRGWMHFAMKTFDDTPVTIACTFLVSGGNPSPRTFELVVEDSVVARRTVTVSSDTAAVEPLVVEFPVPFSLTKGKTSIAIFVRGRGALTPAFHQIRTIQDHYENQNIDYHAVDAWHHFPGDSR